MIREQSFLPWYRNYLKKRTKRINLCPAKSQTKRATYFSLTSFIPFIFALRQSILPLVEQLTKLTKALFSQLCFSPIFKPLNKNGKSKAKQSNPIRYDTMRSNPIQTNSMRCGRCRNRHSGRKWVKSKHSADNSLIHLFRTNSCKRAAPHLARRLFASNLNLSSTFRI